MSAAYVENPPIPDITTDIELHPQVVECIYPKNVKDKSKSDVSVIVREGRAKNVIILGRTQWTNMGHGAHLILDVKKSDSDTIAKTKSRTFSIGGTLSYETNIIMKDTPLEGKVKVDVSGSATFGVSTTITKIRSEEVSETRDLSNYWGDANFCVVYIADIDYYTVHMYSYKKKTWTREVMGVARGVTSELVSSPVQSGREINQNEKPLMLFNTTLSDEYTIVWHPAKETYVTYMDL